MKVVLEDVRMAFPTLFEPKAIGDGKPAYGAKFIIEPGSKNAKKLAEAVSAAAKEKWGEKADAVLEMINEDKKSTYVRGPYKNKKTGEIYDGFEGMHHVTARANGDGPAPSTFDRAKRPVTARDGVLYAGCYVDAVIDVYAQDHPQYGRRINAALKGVRFVRDGEAFGGGSPASADDFADREDDADDLI